MKNHRWNRLLLAAPLIVLMACNTQGVGTGNSNGQNQNQNLNLNLNLNNNHTEPPLEILLTMYGPSGDVVQTRILNQMGPVTIAPPTTEPDPSSVNYVVMAQSDGFYTQLYDCTHGHSIDVQLDGVPALAQALTGVVIRTSYFSPPSYHFEAPLLFTGGGSSSIPTTLTTDAQGRYRLTDVELGIWNIEVQCNVWEEPLPSSFEVENGADTDYRDLFVEIDMSADAPNLYLYPTETTQVTVDLGFPVGGEVVLSDPPYEDGWDVSVAPDGTVDGQFPYLFYEARLPYRVGRERGWILAAEELEGGFTTLLEAHGFAGREITDFLDFWLPLMTSSPWYAIHPMAADELVTLSISPAPDRLRRLWLFMEPLDAPVSINPAPLPPPLPRDGFTAVEWGAFLGR